MEGDIVTMQEIFRFDRLGVDADGGVIGSLTATGIRPAFSEKLRSALVDHRFVLPVLFVIPTVIGFALQYNAWRKPPLSEGGKRAGAAA